MEDYKELRIEADTFDKLRRDADIVLQRALGTMKEKESMDGKVTITIDIKLVPEFIPNYDPAIQGETRKILKPKFDHKVTSAINIKNEEKGSVNPEMAMVWDEDKQEYVLTYVNNTSQRSIFDTDFQEAMNREEEPGVPLLEGDVIDEGALPGPVDGEARIEDFHALFLMYGMTVPHIKYRLGRLLTMLAQNREFVYKICTDLEKEKVGHLKTVQMTKYPEAKEMRGVMKLTKRVPDPKMGFRLTYESELKDRTEKETLAEWLRRENKWQKERAKAKAKSDTSK